MIRKKVKMIKKIRRKTSESYLKTIKRIFAMKNNKIPTELLLKKEYYSEDIKNYKTLGKKQNAENIAIQKTMKYDKCSRKEAKEKVKFANTLGLNYYTYLKNECWEFNKKNLKEYKAYIEKQKEKREFNIDYYANIAKERLNISFDEAKNRFKLIKKKGYPNTWFISRSLFLLTENEIDALKQYESENKLEDKEGEKRRKIFRKTIMNEMNWTAEDFRIASLKATSNCGCNKDEFYLYGLYKMPLSKQREYLTNDHFFKMEMRYSDFISNYLYFQDKSLFNKTFKKYVKRVWFTNENLSYEEFNKKIKNLDNIIYKPIDQLQGKGFKEFSISSEHQKRKAYKYIVKQPLGIVEEFIKQHPDTAKFAPKSVNSLRIATMYKDGKLDILGAVFRTGLDKNFDNWSAGGIICGVNTKTGVVDTDGATKYGKIFKEHLISKIKYRGFQIPNWDKIIKTLNECAKVVEDMPYIGWDVTITEKGDIEIIEGNHNHDIRVFQSIYAISEHKGIQKNIDKYMWFDKKWGE